MSFQYGNTHKKLQEQLKYYEEEWKEYFWNEFVLKHEEKINWNGLSKNKNILFKNIKENPDKPWSWYGLSNNPVITWNIVIENPDKLGIGK